MILGAYDNGKLSGLKVEDKLLLQISNTRTDGNIILPQPVMTVEKFSFEDGDVLVAEVQPFEFPPVRYRGRVWVRVGFRKSIASEAEEKILTERRLSNVHTFDAIPCLGATIADLDIPLIKKEFLPIFRELRYTIRKKSPNPSKNNLLSRLSLEEQQGISTSDPVMTLCLFRIHSESIYSAYCKRINCPYV